MKEFITMNNIKKTGLGLATVAAASTILVAGFAIPANASTIHSGSDHSSSSSVNKSDSSTRTEVTQAQYNALRNITAGYTGGSNSNWSPIYLSPTVNVGDVASGNAVGSGNDSALLSGNEYSIPVLSGNENALLNNDANGDSTTLASGNSSAITGNGVTGNSVTNDLSKVLSPVTKNVTKDSGNKSTTGSGNASSSNTSSKANTDSGNTTTNKTSSSKSTNTSSSSTSTSASSIVSGILNGLGMGGHQ